MFDVNPDDVYNMAKCGDSEETIARELKTTRYQVRKALGKVPPPVKRHRVKKGAPAVALADVQEPILRSQAVKTLRRGWRNLDSLAASLRCNRETVDALVDHLEDSGYLVLRDGNRVRIAKEPEAAGKCWVDKSPLLPGGWRKIGVVGDTHLCSKHCRLDVLEAAYDRFKEEGITDVYHPGNIVDGECRFNKYEITAHGVTDQALYVIDHYPQRSGITTHYITADEHEGWWMQREGIEFGRYLALEARDHGRKDLHHLGYLEADVMLTTPNGAFSWLRVLHPGKGSAYALSYQPQKIIESLQGGEKPAALLVGHFHKQADFMIRNVWTVLTGCTQDQTPWMRKRAIEAHVGFCVVEMQQDESGAVRRMKVEHTSYYDRGYHGVMELGG